VPLALPPIPKDSYELELMKKTQMGGQFPREVLFFSDELAYMFGRLFKYAVFDMKSINI